MCCVCMYLNAEMNQDTKKHTHTQTHTHTHTHTREHTETSEKASPDPNSWNVRVERATIIPVRGCTNWGCFPKVDTTVVTAYRMHDRGFFRYALTAAVAKGARKS